VAKKSRTPTPPRRVQAPQRRHGSGPAAAGASRRNLWIAVAAVAALAIAGAVIGVVVTRGGSSSGKAAPASIDWASLPGTRTTKPPWDNGLDSLQARLPQLQAMGLPPLSAEGVVVHWHQHIDVYVDGKHSVIPASTGIFGTFIMALHVHDNSGILHLESPTKKTYTLGEAFAVWGVRLTPNAVGANCGGPVKAYVNGKQQTGNPEDIVLKQHAEIALVCGLPPAKIPKSFDFKKLGL
jgi:hypothetical protein